MTNGSGKNSRPTIFSRFAVIGFACLCVCLPVLTGCNGHRPGFTRNGSLKAGLSQVQFENDTLKAQIAKLEKQNRQLVADLQREESHSGTLAARLDESRNLLRGKGVNVPLDQDDPSILARSDSAAPAARTTFGEVRSPAPRRSRYADPEPKASETEIPVNDTEKPLKSSKPAGRQPPGFPDDPPSMDRFGEEVPELSANDLSTGWRRLSYRDLQSKTPPTPPR